MISTIALGLYLLVLVILMYQSVIEDSPMAMMEAILLVIMTSAIPAFLGILIGMNIKRKKDGK
jgi:hypothetical protein